MRHIIYKVTNTINGKYYIGRHSTDNINDGYFGSGIGIKNAVAKYGIESFTKEIIAEAFSRSDLWELEKELVNNEVVNDPQSYNMAYGGKHYLHGLQQYDPEKFTQHQSDAGKRGGYSAYNKKTIKEKYSWHSNGGNANAKIRKQKRDHPFYNGEAASLGGLSVKGMIELWNPTAIATNKNQKEYRSGDCLKAKPGSDKYNELKAAGWRTTQEHKQLKI